MEHETSPGMQRLMRRIQKPTPSPQYEWQDIYPELVNKIRWAICSSLKTPGSNYPYRLGQPLATVLSGFAIDIAKQEIETPGSTQSTSSIRSLLG